MEATTSSIVVCLGLLLGLSAAGSQADQEWIAIKNPDEVRTLISGRAIDGKHWVEYYRAVGNMAYLYRPEDSLVIRNWKVDDNGRLCSTVFSKPEFVVDCYELQRTKTEPVQYRGTHKMGVSRFVFLDEPPMRLRDAIREKAGAE